MSENEWQLIGAELPGACPQRILAVLHMKHMCGFTFHTIFYAG